MRFRNNIGHKKSENREEFKEHTHDWAGRSLEGDRMYWSCPPKSPGFIYDSTRTMRTTRGLECPRVTRAFSCLYGFPEPPNY